MKFILSLTILFVLFQTGPNPYPWKNEFVNSQSLQARFRPPSGFARIAVEPESFGAWLRELPLKAGKPDIHLYNGQLKNRQDVHVAIVDIDVGTRDLQQCADAVIRMRAEYLYSKEDYGNLHFNFTNGFRFDYDKWRQGYRVKVNGNTTTWIPPRANTTDDSYPNFKKYLEMAFGYCGTLSLAKEMKPITTADLAPGDVFIRGGSPGHAVLVMDVATNSKGEKVFLLAQSYMPAQEFHILKNPMNPDISPWYAVEGLGDLITPEWKFSDTELRSFKR